MCGRFALAETKELPKRFHTKSALPEGVRPNYNVAPTQDMPVVVRHKGKNALEVMHWGIIPVWAKDKPRFAFSTFNARAESLLEKPMWKKVFPTKRCLVPATGFYEWKKKGSEKQPYYIHSLSDPIFSMAGLYDEWVDKDTGEVFSSFTIITTTPNDHMKGIHDRMPVILDVDEEDVWLNENNQDVSTLLPLLNPYSDKKIELYEVDKRVGNVRNNEKELTAPLA